MGSSRSTLLSGRGRSRACQTQSLLALALSQNAGRAASGVFRSLQSYYARYRSFTSQSLPSDTTSHTHDEPLAVVAAVAESDPKVPTTKLSLIAETGANISRIYTFGDMSTMKVLVAVAVAFASLTSAQNLVPQAASSSFPACGLSCQILLQAQSACVPPAAPVTDQAVYVSCFCQSGYLKTLHSSPDGTCDQWCTVESDRQELMAWYNNLCAAGGAAPVASTTAVSSTSTVSGLQTTVIYVTSTSAPTTTATPSDSAASGSSSGSSGSWYDGRWYAYRIFAYFLQQDRYALAVDIDGCNSHSRIRGSRFSRGLAEETAQAKERREDGPTLRFPY